MCECADLKVKIAGLERVNLELSRRLKQANKELGFLAIDYDQKPRLRKSKLGKEELVLAYEMKARGISTKLVAANFGVQPETLRNRIRRCEKFGMGWLN